MNCPWAHTVHWNHCVESVKLGEINYYAASGCIQFPAEFIDSVHVNLKILLCIFLIFLDPSKIDQTSSNKTILEGSNVTLHCNATGSPASNITWTKDGSPTALHEGEQYAISNISRQQHGNYKCTAWNGVGEQSKTSFSINVLCKQFEGIFFFVM